MAQFLPVTWLTVAVGLGLSACHAPAPQLPPIPASMPHAYTSFDAYQSSELTNLKTLSPEALSKQLGNWWHVFNDPVLNELVGLTITSNWDLLIAAQRIEAASAEVRKVKSAAMPTLYGQADGGRQQSGTTNVLGLGLYDTFGFQAAVSWEPDVYGRVAALTQAAQAEQFATEADRQAIMVSMTAEVVMVYAQLRAMQQKLTLTEQYVALLASQVNLTKDLLQSGLASAQQLAAIQRQFLQAKSALPALNARINILITTCAILTGGYPSALDTLLKKPGPLLAAKLPLPETLPSQLLRQRPDISAQEQRMLASLSSVQAAEAQFLPVFSIPLGVGYNTGPFNLLLNPASFIWNLAASAVAPFYTGGLLESNLQIAQSISKENQLKYEKLVRTALEEVEDAVIGYQGASGTLALLEQVQAQQNIVVVKDKKLFATGLQSKFMVNRSALALTQIKENIVDARYEQTYELVMLYRALGGGWHKVNG